MLINISLCYYVGLHNFHINRASIIRSKCFQQEAFTVLIPRYLVNPFSFLSIRWVVLSFLFISSNHKIYFIRLCLKGTEHSKNWNLYFLAPALKISFSCKVLIISFLSLVLIMRFLCIRSCIQGAEHSKLNLILFSLRLKRLNATILTVIPITI